ncbi:hypothetical protein EGR_06918 [Echinococcus granulosus]|uniref:Uncharacterized protein n=1 Tax=Echinococcus granulosus TaxID=6210 RepID=W6UXC2_ECHGR|nr:hypothetical protein EGR_06918 [Echinococcus granulosus]EUB58174.1 hypothetical protein EGR_06918 [Echinococcus granulosus]
MTFFKNSNRQSRLLYRFSHYSVCPLYHFFTSTLLSLLFYSSLSPSLFFSFPSFICISLFMFLLCDDVPFPLTALLFTLYGAVYVSLSIKRPPFASLPWTIKHCSVSINDDSPAIPAAHYLGKVHLSFITSYAFSIIFPLISSSFRIITIFHILYFAVVAFYLLLYLLLFSLQCLSLSRFYHFLLYHRMLFMLHFLSIPLTNIHLSLSFSTRFSLSSPTYTSMFISMPCTDVPSTLILVLEIKFIFPLCRRLTLNRKSNF